MKLEIKKIPPEGLVLHEEINPVSLGLETEIIKLKRPVIADGRAERITNAVTVDLALDILLYTSCSRCLDEFEISLKKNLKLTYPVAKNEVFIDLGPDIREEIILDYPINPLCKPHCKGLCVSCGGNLNKGECNCKVKS